MNGSAVFLDLLYCINIDCKIAYFIEHDQEVSEIVINFLIFYDEIVF